MTLLGIQIDTFGAHGVPIVGDMVPPRRVAGLLRKPSQRRVLGGYRLFTVNDWESAESAGSLPDGSGDQIGQLEVAPDRARRARVYWQVCREQSTTATSDTESAVSAEVRHDLIREQL